MSRLFTRRHMIGAAGTAGIGTLAMAPTANAALPPTGPLITLRTPLRVFDSRVDKTLIGGAKLASGNDVIITLPGFPEETRLAISVFANVTVTGTEGSGYLVINGADSSGDLPFPQTSNVNWFGNGQTLANVVLTTVGSESGISVSARGGGRTHFIIDVQGYVPFLG